MNEPVPDPPPPSSLKSLLWLLGILAALGLLIGLAVSEVWSEWFSVAEGAAGR